MPVDAPPINRRRFERFATMPMYTGIVAMLPSAGEQPLEGHAYDISEGGIQFELDHAVPPGSAITLRIDLPRWLPAPIDDAADVLIEPKPVEVFASVIWTDDDGVPGPVRMAARFTGFADAAARDRLIDTLAAGMLRRAA